MFFLHIDHWYVYRSFSTQIRDIRPFNSSVFAENPLSVFKMYFVVTTLYEKEGGGDSGSYRCVMLISHQGQLCPFEIFPASL
jgi:hypothetical protein